MTDSYINDNDNKNNSSNNLSIETNNTNTNIIKVISKITNVKITPEIENKIEQILNFQKKNIIRII
jgi:hypothetical protein